jgi:hypothetical protein
LREAQKPFDASLESLRIYARSAAADLLDLNPGGSQSLPTSYKCLSGRIGSSGTTPIAA